MVVTILATIGVLGLLILVHELGHFVAARWFDVYVPRFSIGLGPRVFGFHRGETEFRVGAIPLGGYVKLAGMKEMSVLEGAGGDEAVDPRRTFAAKPPLARAIILSAGVFMNALVGVLVFAAIAMVWGAPVPPGPAVGGVVEEWLPEGAAALSQLEPGSEIVRVGDAPVADMDEVARALMAAPAGPITIHFRNRPEVTIEVPRKAGDRRLLPFAIEPYSGAPAVFGSVVDDRPAARAGLAPGDRVLSVQGRPVERWQELVFRVEQNPGTALDIAVRRADGSVETLVLTPDSVPFADRAIGRMGASFDPEVVPPGPRARKAPAAALAYGLASSRDIVTMMGSFVAGLFEGRHSARDLGGPILIGQLSGAAARAGLPTLLMLTALLSINLAVINLLPIPALDGGHLLLLGVETIRGRPTPEKVRLALGRTGTALVLLLMGWAVAADLLRIFGV